MIHKIIQEGDGSYADAVKNVYRAFHNDKNRKLPEYEPNIDNSDTSI